MIANFTACDLTGECPDTKNEWDVAGSSDLRGFFGCLHKGMIDWLIGQNASQPQPQVLCKKELLQLLRDDAFIFENYYRIFRMRLKVFYYEIYGSLVSRSRDLCENFPEIVHKPLMDLMKWCTKIRPFLSGNEDVSSQVFALENIIPPLASNLQIQVDTLTGLTKIKNKEYRERCPILNGKIEVERLKVEFKSAFYEIVDTLMSPEEQAKSAFSENLTQLLSKPNKNLFSLMFMTVLTMRNIDKHLRKAVNELIVAADDFWKGFNFLVHEKAEVVDKIKMLLLHKQDEKYQKLLLEGIMVLNKLRERAAMFMVGRQLEPEAKDFVLRVACKDKPNDKCERWSADILKRFGKHAWFNFPNKPTQLAKCIGVFTITGTSNLCLLIIDVAESAHPRSSAT